MQSSRGDGEYRLRRVDLSHGETGYEVIVRVTGEKLVPHALSDEMRDLARGRLGKLVQLRIVTQYELEPK